MKIDPTNRGGRELFSVRAYHIVLGKGRIGRGRRNNEKKKIMRNRNKKNIT
jgi:hypothetical protein